MPFIRVRSAVKTDPKHEFDVTVQEATRNAHLYTVVDETPVEVARSATYVTPAKKLARKKPGETTTAPTGANSEGEAHGE